MRANIPGSIGKNFRSNIMSIFKWFKKDPAKKLQKEYLLKLEKAMHAQRNGNIREYSFLTAEAEAVREKLEALDSGRAEA